MESAKPSVYTATNGAGIERVRKEDGMYAFFMEGASIEYNVERNLEILNVHTLGHGAGFILDRKNKIGYCENPKVGTSTWMNYFFWLLPAKKRQMLDDAKEGVNQEMRHAVWKPTLSVSAENRS